MASRVARCGSILHQLRNREIQKARPVANLRHARLYSETIVPNVTVPAVTAPDVLIRKFICGGKFLVCFSRSLHELRLFRFTGPSAVTTGSDDDIAAAFQQDFSAYFSLVYETTVADGGSTLCRDFCLTTQDDEFVILASTCPVARRITPVSTTLQYLLPQENITFHLVRVADGKETDRVVFREDFIQLPHHSGVSLFENFFAVTSIHKQLITVFQLTSSGRFVQVRQVGDYCYEDDPLVIATHREAERRHAEAQAAERVASGTGNGANNNGAETAEDEEAMLQAVYMQGLELPVCSDSVDCLPPPLPSPFTALKQRLLTYLHRMAVESGDSKQLRNFFSNYKAFSGMLLWKMQLLDTQTLLIKFGLVEAIVGRNADGWMNPALLAVYNMHTTQIVNVYTKALPGHVGRMPANPQQFQESPYLDPTVFQYDERAVNALDRPKPFVESPVKFVSRRTGATRFRLQLSSPSRHVPRSKQLTSFVFHPTQPFIMTVQHATNTVSLHFRQ